MTRMWPLWFAMGRVAQAIEVGAVAHGSYMYLLLRSTCYVHDVYSLCRSSLLRCVLAVISPNSFFGSHPISLLCPQSAASNE
jgi:hypothetical protein